MISLSKKFIYIHIPKTGGNTIQEALMSYSDDVVSYKSSAGIVKISDAFQGLSVTNEKLGIKNKHATIEDYFRVLGSDIHDYFIFTSIRNPYDRAISSSAFVHGPKDKYSIDDLFLFPEHLHYLSVKGKIFVENFIRFEHMQSDYEKICKTLNLDSKKLGHRNAAIRGRYQDHYTSECREHVETVYAGDIKYFGYTY